MESGTRLSGISKLETLTHDWYTSHFYHITNLICLRSTLRPSTFSLCLTMEAKITCEVLLKQLWLKKVNTEKTEFEIKFRNTSKRHIHCWFYLREITFASLFMHKNVGCWNVCLCTHWKFKVSLIGKVTSTLHKNGVIFIRAFFFSTTPVSYAFLMANLTEGIEHWRTVFRTRFFKNNSDDFWYLIHYT